MPRIISMDSAGARLRLARLWPSLTDTGTSNSHFGILPSQVRVWGVAGETESVWQRG
jgi:hypothetical protein